MLFLSAHNHQNQNIFMGFMSTLATPQTEKTSDCLQDAISQPAPILPEALLTR